MAQFAQQPHKLFFLLSDPVRLRILCLLQQQSLCVTDLVEILGARQPAVSNHLKKLVKHMGWFAANGIVGAESFAGA